MFVYDNSVDGSRVARMAFLASRPSYALSIRVFTTAAVLVYKSQGVLVYVF